LIDYLAFNTPLEKYWAVDIETDDLNATVIHVMCVKNIGNGDSQSLTTYEDIRTFVSSAIKEGCYFIAHNGIKFDFPVLNRLCQVGIPVSRIIDSLLLSMVYNPSLPKGHSLDSWATRVGLTKFDFKDFRYLTDEMIEYCRQDVEILYRLFLRLTERMRNEKFTNEGLEIEHRAWNIIRKQQNNGFSFNVVEARKLFSYLRGLEGDIRKSIYEIWPPTLQVVGDYKQAYKRDGTHTLGFQTHSKRFPKLEIRADGSYQAFDWVEFNLGSPNQRVEKLISAGWKPTSFTPKGNPKVDEDSLLEFAEKADNEGARLLAKWITINGRANMIGTWLDSYNEKTGCIHGTLWLANTLRYRHSGPNTANIPAVRVGKEGPLLYDEGSFTYEARNLWTTSCLSTRTLVGVDAKGIQLRVLAHYLNNPEFTKQLLEGDPHEYNRQLAGIGTRADAKTFIYAFLLGAGDAKVGQIVKGTTRDGAATKKRFINNFPGLSELLNRLKRQRERTGRITLIDGTPVLVSSDHMVLGYLLQGDESRIMKQAKILVDREISRRKLDVLWVGDIHDEWQSDVLNEHVDEFIEICEWAFKTAGEMFNYNIPIECDAKKGLTWAETH
jgi:DNA polymerase I